MRKVEHPVMISVLHRESWTSVIIDQKHTKGETECILIRQNKIECANFWGDPLLQSHKQYRFQKQPYHLAAATWVLPEGCVWDTCGNSWHGESLTPCDVQHLTGRHISTCDNTK